MTLTRHRLAPIAIALVAIGLAQDMAFFSWLGGTLLVAGFALLGLALLRGGPRPGAEDPVYPMLLVALIVIAAFAQFRVGPPDPVIAGLTLAAGVAFYGLSLSPRLQRYRLYVAAGLLILAHAAFIAQVPDPPHQDVFKFLNRGVDVLLLGHNPYGPIATNEGGPFVFTYPPGVFVVPTPFRVVLGDVRWGYIASEALVVFILGWLLRVRLGAQRWQDALILVPLALPRVSQAFYVYSNHEWVLLALSAGALAMAFRSRWIAAGILLGVGLASKQYFLAFPALFMLPALRRRSLGLGLLLALAICLPFLVWDSASFMRDIFGNLGQAPDPERLTIWAALYHAGVNTGRAGTMVLAVAGGVVTLALLFLSRRELGHSLLACGLALATVALCSPFAAYNYYAYALVFCTWGLLIPEGWDRRRQPRR